VGDVLGCRPGIDFDCCFWIDSICYWNCGGLGCVAAAETEMRRAVKVKDER
jgi:hypothetical protein